MLTNLSGRRALPGAAAAFLLVLALRASAAGPARPPAAAPRWSFTTHTMGTYARVTLFGDDSLAAARLAWLAHRDFMRVDSLMSNWTKTSEVARINRLADSLTLTIDPEVAVAVEEALKTCVASQGAYDITVEPLVRLWGFLGGPKRVPDTTEVEAARRLIDYRYVRFIPVDRSIHFVKRGVKIDLGSLGKGYGALTAARTLAGQGVTNALIDLSGNMVALGAPPGKPGWVIGIRDPRGLVTDLARLTLRDEGIATSGKYEQFVAKDGHTYGHILDPRTGWPSEGLISVTVVSESALTADAWSTALFAMGPAAALRTSGARADIDAVLITPGIGVDTLWVEENLRTRFRIEENAAALVAVKFY